MRTHQGVKEVTGMPQVTSDDNETTYWVRSEKASLKGNAFKSGKVIPIQGPNGTFAAAALERFDGTQVILPIHNIESVTLEETPEERNILEEMRERREALIIAAMNLCDKDGIDTLAIMELKSAVAKYKEATE